MLKRSWIGRIALHDMKNEASTIEALRSAVQEAIIRLCEAVRNLEVAHGDSPHIHNNNNNNNNTHPSFT